MYAILVEEEPTKYLRTWLLAKAAAIKYYNEHNFTKPILLKWDQTSRSWTEKSFISEKDEVKINNSVTEYSRKAVEHLGLDEDKPL